MRTIELPDINYLLHMKMSWNPSERPEPTVCPGKYCFHWVPPGGTADMSGRTYDNLEEVIHAAREGKFFPEGGCGCCFGACKRENADSNYDWYEPDNAVLQKDQLPWFYFIPSVEKLGEEFQEKYIQESTQLWGKHDGL